MTLCLFVIIYRHFGGAWYLHLRVWSALSKSIPKILEMVKNKFQFQ